MNPYYHHNSEFVRPSVKALLLIYLISSIVFSAVILCSTWPTVNIFSWRFNSEDLRFIIMVASGGFLGGSIYTISSFTTFIGTERFRKSWIIWYGIQGLIGATISLIIYLSIRGMILNGNIDLKNLNAYGITTVSLLSGLFSSSIYSKLTQVVSTVLGEKSDVEKQLDKINKTLGVATLDNYKGFACCEIRNNDHENFKITDGKVRLLPGRYSLVICFQPEPRDLDSSELIQLNDGNDVEVVSFNISPKSDRIRFQPPQAIFEFQVSSRSPEKSFLFEVPYEGYEFDTWIEITQKSRIVAVLPLIIVKAQNETTDGPISKFS